MCGSIRVAKRQVEGGAQPAGCAAPALYGPVVAQAVAHRRHGVARIAHLFRPDSLHLATAGSFEVLWTGADCAIELGATDIQDAFYHLAMLAPPGGCSV